MSEQQYAPLYSRDERVRIALRYLFLVLVIAITGELYIIPWITEFINTIHCREFYGVQGIVAMIYGVFVGVPVLLALTIQPVLTIHAIKIIRDKQSPPKNHKVFRKTKIIRGRQALIRGWFLLLCLPIVFIVCVAWGYLSADKWLQSVNVAALDFSVCVEKYNRSQGL